jgi:hypothetical protein
VRGILIPQYTICADLRNRFRPVMIIDHTVRAVGLHLQLILPLVHNGLLPLSGIPCRVRFPEAYREGFQLDDDYHVKMIPVSVSSGLQASGTPTSCFLHIDPTKRGGYDNLDHAPAARDAIRARTELNSSLSSRKTMVLMLPMH